MSLSSCRSLLRSCPLSKRARRCSHVGTVAPTKLTLVLVALLKFSAETWLMLQAMAHCMETLAQQQQGQHTLGHAQHSGGDKQRGWRRLGQLEGRKRRAETCWDLRAGVGTGMLSSGGKSWDRGAWQQIEELGQESSAADGGAGTGMLGSGWRSWDRNAWQQMEELEQGCSAADREVGTGMLCSRSWEPHRGCSALWQAPALGIVHAHVRWQG